MSLTCRKVSPLSFYTSKSRTTLWMHLQVVSVFCLLVLFSYVYRYSLLVIAKSVLQTDAD